MNLKKILFEKEYPIVILIILGAIFLSIMIMLSITSANFHPLQNLIILAIQLLNTLLFFTLVFIGVCIHELGHVVTGLIAGFKIRRVVIGFGRTVWAKIKLFGSVYIFTKGPLGGMTYAEDGFQLHNKNFRVRHIFLYFGGVLFQALLVAMVIAVGIKIKVFDFSFLAFESYFWHFQEQLLSTLNANWFPLVLSHIMYALIYFSIYTNLLQIVFNLFPWIYKDKMGDTLVSDGMRILVFLLVPRQKLMQLKRASSTKIFQLIDLYEAKRFRAVELELTRHLDDFPDPIPIRPEFYSPRVMLSVSLIKQLKLEAAKRHLQQVIRAKNEHPYSYLLYNNLAWVIFLEFKPNLLITARQYSNLSIQKNQEIGSPYYKKQLSITQGCILIEQGKLDAGIALLQPLTHQQRPVHERNNSPAALLYLALAYYQKHQLKQARLYLDKVASMKAQLDLDYRLLLKHVMQKMLSSAPPGKISDSKG